MQEAVISTCEQQSYTFLAVLLSPPLDFLLLQPVCKMFIVKITKPPFAETSFIVLVTNQCGNMYILWHHIALGVSHFHFTDIPVSWATPTVCPAGVQSVPRHRGRLTGTWCLPAPGACLWVACGGLWVGGGGTEPQYFLFSLALSGWGWPCQSWCCWGSVSLPAQKN